MVRPYCFGNYYSKNMRRRKRNPGEFVVPRGGPHLNIMELDEDLPLVAMASTQTGGATLTLRFSGHCGWDALRSFALLYFEMCVEDASALPLRALENVDLATVTVAPGSASGSDGRALAPHEAVFNVDAYPAELCALEHHGIVTLQQGRTVGVNGRFYPVGTIHLISGSPRPPSSSSAQAGRPPRETGRTSNPAGEGGLCCAKFDAHQPNHSIHAFMLFTALQVLVFIFRPGWYKNAAPDIDSRIFVLIGVKELGLLCIYLAIAWANDRRLMAMTVVGRLMVVPYMGWIVGVLGGPTSALAGVLQDISFGGWTWWSLRLPQPAADALAAAAYDGGITKNKRQKATGGLCAGLTRVVLCVAGATEAIAGILIMLDPGAFLQNASEHSWMAFARVNGGLSSGIHLGVRSIALMNLLLGSYQICIGVLGAPPNVYLACGLYHLVFVVSLRLVKLWRVDLDTALSIPTMHYVFGPAIVFLGLHLSMPTRRVEEAFSEKVS
jgi:hypothetical protein